MKLASIEKIISVEKHPNADLLDLVKCLGYTCIVKRDEYKVGDLVVFIEPDSVLPDSPWSVFYRSKSNRVKAIRLRNFWSFGIVESINNVGYAGPVEEGLDITESLGISHYEPPAPKDLSASGPYGFGIPKTDQYRWQSIVKDLPPWGTPVDVTLKVDGQSLSCICKLTPDGDNGAPTVERAVGGRSFLYKLDSVNNYTKNEKQYDVLNRLEAFCRDRGVNLCIRGESYGLGIQSFSVNPHSKLPLGLAFFSTWLIDERKYACKGHPLYIHDIAPIMGLPTVPILEKNVPLTPELIKKYDEELEKIDGKPFEGVVINHPNGSFKIINKYYDSKK